MKGKQNRSAFREKKTQKGIAFNFIGLDKNGKKSTKQTIQKKFFISRK